MQDRGLQPPLATTEHCLSVCLTTDQVAATTAMLIENTVNVFSEETLEQIAREEFQEDEQEMEEAVGGLQDWIVSCPHLANCRTDQEFLR